MAVKILNGIDVYGSMNIDASDVPNLDASKITSGTFSTDRIPNLSSVYQPLGDYLTLETAETTFQPLGNYLTEVPSTFDVTSIGIGNKVTISESTDREDLLYINSHTEGWGGLQIGNTSNEFIFSLMGNGNAGGIYDDQNSDWIIYWDENAGVQLNHNSNNKLNTVSDGVNITGRLYASSGIQVPYGSGEHRPMVVLSGATNYGLFHTEATNDEFTFDFNGTQKFKFSQDGILTVNGNTVTTGKITNWDTAYGWGNHASVGYLTSIPSSYATDAEVNSAVSVVNDRIDTEVIPAIGAVTLASLGYTGATNANYITNNNQLTNGAGYATTSYVNTAVANIVDTAPAALNTLNELAAALGDDANFSTTVSNNIGAINTRIDTEVLPAIEAKQNAGNYFTDGDTVLNMANNDGLVYDDTTNKMYVKLDGTNREIYHTGNTSFLSTGGGTLTGATTIQTTGGAMLTLKDTNSVGDEATPYISFVDSAGTRQGYIGIGSGSNAKLYLEGLDGIQANNPLSVSGTVTATGGNSSDWNTAYGWGNHASAGYLTSIPSSYATDAEVATAASNAQANAIAHADTRIETEVLPAIGGITLASLGFTGATNANYITNNNQLTNGAGYLTATNDRVYITDSRGSARAPSYYNDRYAQWDFQNQSDTGAGGDSWHGLLTVSKWSVYDSSHKQEQLIFTGDNLKRRTATSDSTWGTIKTIWDTGNLGVGDGGLTEKNFTTTLKTKLDGIAASANNYSHPGYTARSINTSGAAVLDILTVDTSGHVTAASTRNLTLADLGYTGATNANYITNNNQLTNGAGYATEAFAAGAADTVNIRIDNEVVPAIPTNNNQLTNGAGYVTSSHTHTPSQVGLSNLSANGNSLAGNFTATGDITAFSDARVKENIETLPNALESVKQMRGVTYNKIGEEKQSIGVIAQELEEVVPQLVHTDEEGMKSVAYGNITALLIEALKEQQEQIEELKAKLNGLTK